MVELGMDPLSWISRRNPGRRPLPFRLILLGSGSDGPFLAFLEERGDSNLGPATARNGLPVTPSRYGKVRGDSPAGGFETRGSRAFGSRRNRCSPPVEWSRSAARLHGRP